MRQAQAVAPKQSFLSAIEEVKRLENEQPDSATLRNAYRKVLKLASRLSDDLDQQVALSEASNNSKEQKEAVKLSAYQIKEWSSRMLDRANVPMRGMILYNPNLPATKDNAREAQVLVKPGDRAQILKESRLRHAFVNGGKKFGGMALNFSTQAVTLGAAAWLMSAAQLGLNYQNNPVAFDQWLAGQEDPMALAGLGVFMLANHQTAKLLMGVKEGRIPRSMIPYIGMVAGSLAQDLFHDIVADLDMHKCVKSNFSDDASCAKAFDHWVLTNKVLEYTPGLITMVASQAVSDAARAFLTQKTAQKAAVEIDKTALRLTFSGIRTVRAAGIGARIAQAGTTVLAGGLNPVSLASGGAQLLIFLVLDAEFSEPLLQAKNDALLASFNLKTWLDKWGWHREYFFPPKDAKQLIANAFDVEATDLYSAHQYLMTSYTTLGETNWQKPPPAESCIPADIANGKPIDFSNRQAMWSEHQAMWIPGIFDFFAIPSRVMNYKKSNDQLRCEVLHRPTELFTRYTEKNKEWRDNLLTKFTSKQQNWLALIGNFNDVLQASQKVANYLADAKFNMEKKGAARPDLSRAALEKLLADPSTAGAPGAPAEADAHQTYGSYYAGLATHSMVEYVVAALACGPKPGAPVAAPTGLTKLWKSALGYVKGYYAGGTYMETKFGSSFAFTPPNMTSGDGSICANGEVTYAMDYSGGEYGSVANSADVMEGKFNDRASGKTYTGLADYIFDNIDPTVYRDQGDYSHFASWWDKNILVAIESVWNSYEQTYQSMLETEFMPVVFTREFRNGCEQNVGRGQSNPNKAIGEDGLIPQTAKRDGKNNHEYQCSDASTAYRVGRGVFISLEVELRNYLRGLYSINSALYANEKPEVKKASQKAFLDLANDLISRVVKVNKGDLRSDTLTDTIDATREKAAAINDLIEARMETLKEPADSFRRTTLKQLSDAAQGLIVEQGQYSSQVTTMEFMGSTSRPVDQKVYSRKQSSPFNRGSQQ